MVLQLQMQEDMAIQFAALFTGLNLPVVDLEAEHVKKFEESYEKKDAVYAEI